MFTGIVEKMARIASLLRHSSGARLSVENPWGQCNKSSGLEPGASISVNGACLTIISANDREISFDMSEETLKKTTFAAARTGMKVNLERALRLGDAISGHLVSGHVDSTGRVERVERSGDFAEFALRIPDDLVSYVVPKGSIAVDGVSLTVAAVEGNLVTIALIPETLARTTLSGLQPGDETNVETDLIGKYVIRHLSAAGGALPSEAITLDRMEKAGF